jgi:tRNA(adenine34) deaminase
MCSYVIRHHQIETIVFGVKSEYIGGISSEFKILETENIPRWKSAPEIIEGVLEIECQKLTEKFKMKVI